MAGVKEFGKADLVAKVAEHAEISKATAHTLVSHVLDSIKELLLEGSYQNDTCTVKFVGFGTFQTRRTAARKGRNPRTGEAAEIPAGMRLTFSCSKKLREEIKSIK